MSGKHSVGEFLEHIKGISSAPAPDEDKPSHVSQQVDLAVKVEKELAQNKSLTKSLNDAKNNRVYYQAWYRTCFDDGYELEDWVLEIPNVWSDPEAQLCSDQQAAKATWWDVLLTTHRQMYNDAGVRSISDTLKAISPEHRHTFPASALGVYCQHWLVTFLSKHSIPDSATNRHADVLHSFFNVHPSLCVLKTQALKRPLHARTSVLEECAKVNDVSFVKCVLEEVDEQALKQCPRICEFAWRHVDVLRVFLEAGCDANGSDENKEPAPLLRACSERNVAAIKLLLEHGADINAKADIESDKYFGKDASAGHFCDHDPAIMALLAEHSYCSEEEHDFQTLVGFQ